MGGYAGSRQAKPENAALVAGVTPGLFAFVAALIGGVLFLCTAFQQIARDEARTVFFRFGDRTVVLELHPHLGR